MTLNRNARRGAVGGAAWSAVFGYASPLTTAQRNVLSRRWKRGPLACLVLRAGPISMSTSLLVRMRYPTGRRYG